MRYTVKCGTKHNEISLDKREDYSSNVAIEVGGKSLDLRVVDTRADGEIASVVVNNHTYAVEIERRSDGFPSRVILDGRSYLVTIDKVESTRFKPPAKEKVVSGAVNAILPGTISTLLVREGDQVKKGQPLLILEAMKMENEIAAPRDGKITGILVKKGQLVMRGDKLMEIG